MRHISKLLIRNCYRDQKVSTFLSQFTSNNMVNTNALITKPMEIIPPTGKTHSGTVIFLHGSGDSGVGVCDWIKNLSDFSFPHLKVLFPTAPLRPYTPNGGMPSNVWYDRLGISPDVPDHLETLDPTAQEIINIISHEVEQGIPFNRIAIGGFSMGGGMAMHIGYRFLPELAAVFALSSFLCHSCPVFKALEKGTPQVKFPPLFMSHGTADSLIPEKWGQDTFSKITSYDVEGKYNRLPEILHELDGDELKDLHNWLLCKIPE